MGSGEVEDQKGGTPFNAGGAAISCSICLEVVTDSGDRSTARLQCGHQFHLDCIGSAFNAKGAMQCPNCRKVEKGQWLFANGYRAFADFGMDDWTHDEDLYDLSYSEIPFGVHWCPFRGFTQLSSSFEDADPSSSAYQDLFGRHAIFADHASASSTTHACPYLALHAFVQPVHQPSSSSNSDTVADVTAFHHHWAGLSGPADIATSHGFPGTELHHNWEPHSPPFSPTSGLMQSSDQASAPTAATQRSSRTSFDSDGLPRIGAFLPPFLFGHGSSRAASSVISSGVPPYVVNSRGHARVHAYQQTSPAIRGAFPVPSRRSAPRSLAPVPTSHLGAAAAAATPLDHGGFYSTVSASSRNRQDGESSGSRQNHGHGWERERFAPFPWVPVDGESHWWGPFHHGQAPTGSTAGGPDSVHRSVHWLYAGVDRAAQTQAAASGAAAGSDSVSRSTWWPSYSTMDRAGQGQPPPGVGTSDPVNRTSLWQLYVDRGGQGRNESPYQHHVRLPRMPPFM
ncbi:unnamed protein product [Victoria cruziana]